MFLRLVLAPLHQDKLILAHEMARADGAHWLLPIVDSALSRNLDLLIADRGSRVGHRDLKPGERPRPSLLVLPAAGHPNEWQCVPDLSTWAVRAVLFLAGAVTPLDFYGTLGAADCRRLVVIFGCAPDSLSVWREALGPVPVLVAKTAATATVGVSGARH